MASAPPLFLTGRDKTEDPAPVVRGLLVSVAITLCGSALAEAARVALLATLFVDQCRIPALRAQVSLHRA